VAVVDRDVAQLHLAARGRQRHSVRALDDLHRLVEHVGDALGVIRRRAEGDLERFKQFIESRDSETGAWRGTVEQSNS